MKRLTVPFFIAHRGCPHRCVFCDQVKISGGGEELPRQSDIAGKINAYRESAGRNARVEVAFFGGSFTGLPLPFQEQLLMSVQPFLDSGEVEAIRISTRPDAVSESIAHFLKERGVKTVELGVQSLADDVLRQAGRGHGSREVFEAVACLRKAGLAIGLQLMPGLPADTPEKSLRSLKLALSLAPDFLRIYPTLVIAGTRLEELYRCGDYQPLSLQQAVSLCKIMLLEAMRAHVPVIRMGLQPTDELQAAGVVVAGPYHPAFRQVVAAELYGDLLLSLASSLAGDERTVSVVCSPSRVADVVGQKRSNVLRLLKECGITLAAVNADQEISPYEVCLVSDRGVRRANILRDIHY